MANTIKIKQIDQTQLAAFVNDILDGTGAVYTANRALVTDGSGDVTTSSVTATELGYLSGVTSAIQTQFNNLGSTYLALAGGIMTGPITLHASSLLKWGATASFPALKRNSAELQVRLADDSEFTGLRCSYLNIQPASGLSWLYFGSQYVVTISSKFLFSGGINLSGGDLEMWDKGIYFGSNGTQINDIYLIRDAAGVLSQRYGATAQTLRVYGTYTDASNYARASLAATSTSVTLSAETAGTGADDIDIAITPAGTGLVKFGSHSAIAAETITGYITIKDSGGTSRKIAVIS